MRVEIKNLILNYYGNEALDIPSLTFDGCLGVVGCSGAGKSNFLKALAGLEYIKSGEIYFDGVEITDKKPRDRGIAFLNECTPLFKNKSVYYNLAYPLKKHKEDRADTEKRIACFKFDSGILKEKVKNLPIKQQTDVLLARSLIRNPSLLLIDEPAKFTHDPEYFYSALNKIKNRKNSVSENSEKSPQMIIATYNLDDIKDLCNQFLILRDGKTAAFGTIKEIKNSHDKYVAAMA